MLDDMRVNDEQLDISDIRQLESADEIAHFFAKLRYDVDERTNIPDYAVLGMSGEDMRQHIQKIELLGKDPADGDIVIYLFEVRSVTAKLRNDIARRFRERPENALLVLTKDYEELEFVLLERVVSRSQSRRAALKQAIRPIPLTVNRLNPDPIALRVLKRFTFTEEDAAYQWEKLRSAYMLAEWSEEYFNNRALFSDYYLKERLTDEKITPEWREDVRPIGREIFRHLTTARKSYTRQAEDVIRAGLFEPVFRLLGFDFVEGKPGSSGADEADYLLYTPGDESKPIAAALTYVWNRNLDDVDESRERDEADGGTPFEIPGAIVVSLLENQTAPWVIVTNGKLWRLYSSTASNKATNYYEIDLEEAIAATDREIALKYWWLMFRQEAFTGFLDNLLKNSADYAKELGDRLKDRVFVEIFPQFAKGFIADMRGKGIKDFDEAGLATVFSGTMTFLYRLMFILYAESLELLPLNEVRGYQEHSLYRMKREIAEAGGTILDDSSDKLSKQYKASAADLYERLKVLFGVVDIGSDELNMPTYNGGLFSTETDGGKFLDTYVIPDRYLALGLDRLTRDVDTRTQALAFIDFKSLGVRQLGSIYEGLLEFKLKIAAEALAVTKEKGKEIYQPAKAVKKPLATLARGDVYLENDKQERKATGSYYTPDYIVKYIVRHTVGPVLERKFKALTDRLHKAQRGYRDYARLVEARRKSTGRDESPATYWNSAEMQQLVDDCLNVRVLDPAMGSGHFLVEVVDYTSNRLIDFLNGWSENPVWAFLEQTRDDILNDMERQHVTIDADRLTRVAMLKRAVLKRCVYGVDLNAMAVELAKVSLWLDAFTLGAPLSFLDHHLKHGNSLIGARVADVQAALEGQQTLFSQNKFAGVMLATDLMRQVSYLSDNTIEQTRQSAQAYHDARDHLAPYKRVLDVYTSRWFGNAPTTGRRGGTPFDPTIEFLRRDDTQKWLEDPRKPENHLPADDYMKAGLVAKTALNAAEDKSFFHWELEFPEVFFAPSKPGGQDVQLSKDGGFDVIVGNPPYGATFETEEKDYFTAVSIYARGKPESYIFFTEIGLALLPSSGHMGLITPNAWLTNYYGIQLREFVLKHACVRKVVNLEPVGVFEEAVVDTTVVVMQRESSDKRRNDNIVTVVEATQPGQFDDLFSANQQSWYEDEEHLFNVMASETDISIINQVEQNSVQLADIGEYSQGIIPYKTKQDAEGDPHFSDKQINNNWKPAIESGEAVDRYFLAPEGRFIHYGKWLWCEREPKYFDSPKILFHRLRKKLSIQLIGVYDEAGFYNRHSLSNYILHPDSQYDLRFVLAIFNSTLANWWFVKKFGLLMEVGGFKVLQLPIYRIDFTTPAKERERLARQIIDDYEMNHSDLVLKQVPLVLGANQTDVVHDVLAHLAGRMIDLNKEKQAQVKRFLDSLEGRLRIAPKNGEGGIDSLTGKTVIQGYLGDYQKGEGELPWREFLYRLHQNRNRFAVSLADVEGEIQREFEESLDTLIPIKRDLARTDALIDKIVYRLYGLTDAEIELIERPQYEQALADAKAQVIADETITDDEEKIDKIAENILPAAQRFFERVETPTDEDVLDRDLPHWRDLPPDAPTFLLTGDYNLRSLPDHMDFSSSVIPYTKAVEVTLHRQIFEPFRDSYSDADCHNDFLQDFMRGKRHLTLGSAMIILGSSKETALRNFMAHKLSDVEGLVTILDDEAMRDIRNKAAHDEVLSRDEAQQTRDWAIGILGMV